MATPGNFAQVAVNGYDVTTDSTELVYTHAYTDNKILPQNVGLEGHAPGAFMPKLSYNGYAKHGNGAITAHNILFPTSVGGANDLEYIITAMLGNNASPQQGDDAILFDGTLLDYTRPNPLTGIQAFQSQFQGRGKRMPPFPKVQWIQTAFKTATNLSNTPYDDGTEASAGTSLGGVGVLQVTSPTGTAATGSISLTGQPSDADAFTLTIGGVAYVYTFKTALTPTAGQVLIGANVAATAANLFAAMTGGVGAGTTYAAGTVSIPQYPLSTALVSVAVPTSSQVINLTALNTGTAANAYTLVASPNVSTKLSVSGANMSGGVAGDQYTITLASATSSGGSYTTHITWSNVGAQRGAFRTEVAIGTLINEWIKITSTLASGAGTAQTMAFNVCFGRYFQS